MVSATILFSLSFLFCFISPASADVYVNRPLIELSWAVSPEPDVSGYEVHRAVSVGGTYAKLHEGTISDNYWADTAVTDGGTYYYKLRAVDTCGNLSALSPASAAAIVDLTPPVVAVDPSSGIYGRPITVFLTASEPSTIYYTTDGSVPTSSSRIYAGGISVAANTTLRYFAVDSALNTSAIYSAQYTVSASDGDMDDDGYPDALEEAMQTDPLDPNSQPIANALVLSPTNVTLGIGMGGDLTVMGTFNPSGQDPIQHDMTCLVEYVSSAPSIVSVNGCGTVDGISKGSAIVTAYQLVNGTRAVSSNTAAVVVDDSPPFIDIVGTYPYNGQGMDGDTGPTPRVPVDTGIVTRLVDDVGIDKDSVSMSINGIQVPTVVREIVAGDSREIELVYRSAGNFAFDEIVTVVLSLSDIAGNPMNGTRVFKTESEAEHLWALSHMPIQRATDLGNGLCEITIAPQQDGIDDEPLGGAKIIFDCSEPIPPRFGPVGELPILDIATPVGIPLSIEPANVFNRSVTLILPVPQGDMRSYEIYHYAAEPSLLWNNAADVRGWSVDGSRLDHPETVPPTIEVQVNSSGGVQVGHNCLPPFANYSANPMQLEVGETAQFVDTSSGPVTGWLWNFGDRSTSTLQNPAHTYGRAGTYSPTLTVTGPCGTDTVEGLAAITVCDRIHLLSPADGSQLSRAPSVNWSPSCDLMFQVEVARDAEFLDIIYVSPVLSPPPYPPYKMPSKLWKRLPTKTWLYWRVKGWTDSEPSNVHMSAETWTFMKTR